MSESRSTWPEDTESEELVALLQQANTIMIDFDGPLCRLFESYNVSDIADEVKVEVMSSLGSLPASVANSSDPHGILVDVARSVVGRDCRELLLRIEEIVTEHEIKAAGSAEKTLGANELVRTLRRRGKRLCVASNNSPESVVSYLKRQRLIGEFEGGVFGREKGDPLLMKPNPRCLDRARKRAGVKREECLFVGDSVADVQAAAAADEGAGIPFIGLATTAARARKLRDAGALVVVPSIELVLKVLPSVAS